MENQEIIKKRKDYLKAKLEIESMRRRLQDNPNPFGCFKFVFCGVCKFIKNIFTKKKTYSNSSIQTADFDECSEDFDNKAELLEDTEVQRFENAETLRSESIGITRSENIEMPKPLLVMSRIRSNSI